VTHASRSSARALAVVAVVALVAALGAALLAGCGQRVGGIHARMGYSEQHGLRVVDVPRTGPAWGAGLRPGDRIVEVDGAPVSELPLADVVRRLRGPIGSEVQLTIQRDDQLYQLEVQRVPYSR